MAMAMANGMDIKLKRRHRSRASHSTGSRFASLGRPFVILLVGALALVVTLQVTVASAVAHSDPHTALRFSPRNASALSRLAMRLARFDEGASMARGLARSSIERDPIQPEALWSLGQVSSDQPGNRTNDALAIMRESERLSRREGPTQLWLAEHFGKIGDARRALHHFDVMLRVSLRAQEMVFPLLIAGSNDPQTEVLLLETLKDDPSWGPTFSAYAVTGGTNLDFAIRVARQSFDPRDAEGRKAYITLMERLASAGRLADAWALYRTPSFGRREGAAAPLRDGSFEGGAGITPFDWAFVNEADLWAARSREAEADGWALLLAASNGRAGVVASQFLHLSLGPHRLRARFGNVPADRFERPEIAIECTDSDARVLSLSPAGGRSGATDISGTFAVAPDCPFQRLVIRVAGQGARLDPLLWIDNLRID